MNETQRRRALADVKEFFLRAGALAALLLVLFGVVFGLAIQSDDTMYPHLKPGDLLLYYRLPRSAALQRGRWSSLHRMTGAARGVLRPAAATPWR